MHISPTALIDCNSAAEKKIFSLLKGVELGKSSVCYHSLNCSKHEYKCWAEIDFLILDPNFAIVLEVKGGRIEQKNGEWTYVDRFDDRHKSKEGPFKQAKTAMFALQNLLVDRYDLPLKNQNDLCFGFGVVFPDIDWDIDTVEMPRELVADRRQCSNPEAFKRYLESVKKFWRAKTPGKEGIGTDLLNAVKSRLRPDVDVYPPFSTRIGYTTDKLGTLTSEQFYVADIIDANDRVIVSGGAGTGKTYLLVQCVRIASANGEKCLVIVHSKVLAAHLHRLLEGTGATVTPIDKLQSLDASFDVLFVDEGQDLMSFDTLDPIGRCLLGGLDHGRWRWFMDENHQSSISGRFDEEALAFMTSKLDEGIPTRVPLKKNVRNTREVARRVILWTGSDIGETEISGHGGNPKLHVVSQDDEEPDRVTDLLTGLFAQGVDRGDVGLILSSDCDPSLIQRLDRDIRENCVRLDTTTVKADLLGRTVFGSVVDFKGLERPIVLAIGFRGKEFVGGKKSELYVALTRANYAFHLFADNTLASLLKKNESENQRLI